MHIPQEVYLIHLTHNVGNFTECFEWSQQVVHQFPLLQFVIDYGRHISLQCTVINIWFVLATFKNSGVNGFLQFINTTHT
jgi:hypothetical protein